MEMRIGGGGGEREVMLKKRRGGGGEGQEMLKEREGQDGGGGERKEEEKGKEGTLFGPPHRCADRLTLSYRRQEDPWPLRREFVEAVGLILEALCSGSEPHRRGMSEGMEGRCRAWLWGEEAATGLAGGRTCAAWLWRSRELPRVPSLWVDEAMGEGGVWTRDPLPCCVRGGREDECLSLRSPYAVLWEEAAPDEGPARVVPDHVHEEA